MREYTYYMPGLERDSTDRLNILLAELTRRWPLAKGSLVEVRKPCVRPRCLACQSGRRHPAFIFSFMEKGRRRCMYVPRALVAALRRAIENGRWMEGQIAQQGRLLIEEFRREQAGRSPHRGE
jgi:hypothetical protein